MNICHQVNRKKQHFKHFCSEVAVQRYSALHIFPSSHSLVYRVALQQLNANTLAACVRLNQKALEGRNDSNIVVRLSPVPARVCVLFSSKRPGTCGHFERHE